jgi:hypothetical protein
MAENQRPGRVAGGDLAGAEEVAEREAVVEAAAPEGQPGRGRHATTNGSRSANGAAAAPARPASISITQGGMDTAIADSVRVRQGGISQADATDIEVSMGGIGRANATDIVVSMGGVGLARADRISVAMGGIGLAAGEHVEVSQGGATAVIARDAHIGPALIRSLVASTVVVEKPTGVVFLVARQVSGDVRTLFDWRGALAFGAVVGLVMGLVRRVR